VDSLDEKDSLIVRCFLRNAEKRATAGVDEFLQALESIAQAMGSYVGEKTGSLLGGRPFVMGVGADFQEFTVPFVRGMGVDQRARVGCLWPYPSIVDPGQQPLIFFNQTYLESDPYPSNALIISQSVISDKHQIEAVVERARELKTGLPVIIMCAVSTREAALSVQSLTPNIASMMSAITVNDDDVRLDYWELEALLDRRERKFVPRLAKCLGDRLDAGEDQLDRYPWRPQRTHYGWPPAPKADW
jgi:hypothetical protein